MKILTFKGWIMFWAIVIVIVCLMIAAAGLL
jgi:hypothetical protein